MSAFWSPEFRSSEDALNAEIWSRSPGLQLEIQPPSEARSIGAGAQQAMLLDDSVLPWVPDILGRNWREADSIVIVGSAYAPFVERFANRGRVMSLAAYENASTWQEFEQAFVASVVDGDDKYYDRLIPLAVATPTPNDCSGLAILDLCRASFVTTNGGKFNAGDNVVKEQCRLFESYVEHPQNQSWLWQRLTATEASRIVALGTIAEHGLLRLFARQRGELRVNGTPARLRTFPSGAWVKDYADRARQLSFWLQREAWWEIRGVHRGTERVWRLLPIVHPAYAPLDGYARQRELLAKMLPLAT